MSLTAEQIFDAIAPEYKNHSDKATYLELAESRISSCAFGVNRPHAVALRAAHDMTLNLGSDQSGSGGGPITGKKEGNLSIQYAGPSSGADNGDDLILTKYGRQLKGLMRGNIAAVGVTGGADNGC